MSQPEVQAYGPHPEQFCELFAPAGAGPHPVAVMLHGGFWKAQYDRTQTHPLCADLAARGWAAWNVEYRRMGDGGGFPATLEDVATAVAAVPGAPPRVVAIGHSAGGHLAAWLGARVDAVVAQAGVVDLRLGAELGLSDGVVERFLGGLDDERFRAASPAERLPLGVPVLLTHGGRDDIVPPVISERFAIAARAAGDSVDLVVDPEADHFAHLDPAQPLWQAVVAWLAG